MVRNVINVIEDRCEEGVFPEEFRERIRQNVGFDEARKVILTEYDQPQVVRVNKVDLQNNIVKSKISQFQRQTYGQTYGQTAQSYIIGMPINTGSSYISNIPYPM